MSRNGRSTSAPSRTIRIFPPCSTTNSRPLPSPAFATSTGFDRPVTATDTVTLTAFGSNAAAAEPVGVVGLAEAEVETPAVAAAGVSIGGEPVSVGSVDAVGEQAVRLRRTTTKATARIRDIGRC